MSISIIPLICLWSLAFGVLVFLVYAVTKRHPPLRRPPEWIGIIFGYIFIFMFFLGFPWSVILILIYESVGEELIDRHINRIKTKVLCFHLMHLPICDSSVVQQIQERFKKNTADQAWLETRTLEQVMNRYEGRTGIRRRDSLDIKPDNQWLSGFFITRTTLIRIGKSEFLDYSTSTINQALQRSVS